MKDQKQIFHYIDSDEIEKMEELVQKGVSVNARGEYSTTPLMHAAGKGKLEIAKWLLDHGAEVNLRDEDGDTAFMFAIKFYKLDIAELLLKHGAKINYKSKGDSETPLLYACRRRGYEQAASLLIDAGAKLNEKDGYGMTALMYTVSLGTLFLSRKLIDAGANISEQRKGSKQETAMVFAIKNNDSTMVSLLIQEGANINDFFHSSFSENEKVANTQRYESHIVNNVKKLTEENLQQWKNQRLKNMFQQN